jgi:hypothetical protein
MKETKMTNVLDQVRGAPEATFNIYDFYVDGTDYPVVKNGKETKGGPCQLSAETSATVTKVKVRAEPGRDYYFPWQPSGVGSVEVPTNAPDGTIVVTGGMNGCAMEVVQRDGTTLVFYHDADGCALRSSVPPVSGETLYRCDYRNYASNQVGYKTSDALKMTKSFLYQFVFVKSRAEWKVFVCGILLSGSQSHDVTGTFNDHPNKLIGSFTKFKNS